MTLWLKLTQAGERAKDKQAHDKRDQELVRDREALQKREAELITETERVSALEADVKAKALDAAERVSRAETVLGEAKAAREKHEAEVTAAVTNALKEAGTPTSVWVLSAMVVALLAACAHLWLSHAQCSR
jgi:uncharacterized protein (DUF3084 family)